ncbi:ribosome biogenesis GTPase Der [Myxococcota bacterium]|nr:ribosome biogenesis GTPase Der [Myxococcota bacterium]
MKPVVAIVGRPNVGKSSLFNRILGRRKAVVEGVPGVTRDRNYAVATHGDRSFIVVDTGGFDEPGSRELAREVRDQAVLAMEEADVIVVVFDARAGLTALDQDLVEMLRRVDRPVLYAANKVDHPSVLPEVYDFLRTGIEDVIPVSAAHNYGVEDLLDRVVERMPEEAGSEAVPEPWEEEGTRRRPSRKEARERSRAERALEHAALREWGGDGEEDLREAEMDAGEAEALLDAYESAGGGLAAEDVWEGEEPGGEGPTLPEEDADFEVRLSVLGRPNVGKSTLVNRLLGFERTITSEVPGTTRDSVDTRFERDGRRYVLIDTAGIRRKARISDTVERYSVARALHSLEACHLAVLLVDALEGVTEQEARLAALADDRGRGLLIAVNKWDAVEDAADTRKRLDDQLDRRLPHVRYAPVVTISARTGLGIGKLWKAVAAVDASHRLRIPTGQLNRWLEESIAAQPPPLWRRYPIKFYFATQIGVRPPVVVVFANRPEGLDENYRRFLMNRFRAAFDVTGTPVKLLIRKR